MCHRCHATALALRFTGTVQTFRIRHGMGLFQVTMGHISGSLNLPTLQISTNNKYPPGSTNRSLAGKWGPLNESMYFLLKMGIFQPAMLVYQRVFHIFICARV